MRRARRVAIDGGDAESAITTRVGERVHVDGLAAAIASIVDRRKLRAAPTASAKCVDVPSGGISTA